MNNRLVPLHTQAEYTLQESNGLARCFARGGRLPAFFLIKGLFYPLLQAATVTFFHPDWLFLLYRQSRVVGV